MGDPLEVVWQEYVRKESGDSRYDTELGSAEGVRHPENPAPPPCLKKSRKKKNANAAYGEAKKDGNSNSLVVLVKKTAVPSAFFAHFRRVLQVYSKHKFIHLWQAAQRRLVDEDFPLDAMLIELDFAENLSITCQDQPQSQHWITIQVTLLNFIVKPVHAVSL